MDDSIPQKRCSKCRQMKPATNKYFHLNKHLSSGLHAECKACRKGKNPRNIPDDVPEGLKYCSKCDTCKPATSEHFGLNKDTLDGLCYRCKECRSLEKRKPIDPASIGKKKCNKCLEWKPATLDYFYAAKKGKYGLYARCKMCIGEIYKAHAQEVIEYHKVYNAAHAEHQKDYFKRYHKLQNKLRPEVLRTARRNRRARTKSAIGSFTPEQIQEQLKRQHYRCYYTACGRMKFERANGKYVYHVDHVVPLSRGGTNDISNIVLTCPHCNLSKNRKLPHEWPQGGRLM